MFSLEGAATGANGQPTPIHLSGGDGSGDVPGVPGLVATSGENVASITRAGMDAFDFTFNEAPTTVNASDFFVYTRQDGQIAGSAATASGEVVRVTFPLPSRD